MGAHTQRHVFTRLILACCLSVAGDASAQLLPIEWDNDSGDSLWNTHANWGEVPSGKDPSINDALDFRRTTFSGAASSVFLKSNASPSNLFLATSTGGMEFIDAGGEFVLGGPICEFGCRIESQSGSHLFEPTVRIKPTSGEGISFIAQKGTSMTFDGAMMLENDLLNIDASGEIFINGPILDLSNGTTIAKRGGGDLWLTNDNSPTRFGKWELLDGWTHAITSAAFGDGDVVQIGGGVIVGNSVTLDNTFHMIPIATANKENSIFVGRGDAALIKGPILGSGDFVKRGGGTLTLDNGVHPFSGLATIADGTLTMGGRLNGSVNVQVDGTLTGEPTILGDVQSAGVIAPGYSPGVIEISGDLFLTGESTVEIEIGGLDPGSEHDLINVSGVTVIGGVFEFPLIGGFVPSPGDVVKFLNSNDIEGNGGSIFPIVPNLPADLAARVVVDSSSLRLEIDKPQNTQFVAPSPLANWENVSAWSADADPTTTDILRINNVSTSSLQVLSVNQNAFAHSIVVEDPSRRIHLNVNGANLTALSPAGITIGRNATLELGTAGGTGRVVTPTQVTVRDGGQLIGNGEIVGPTGTESGVDRLKLDVGQSKTSGTLSPGNTRNSAGNIHVRGDLILGPSASTEIQINSVDEFDTVTLDGQMSLGGKLSVDASAFSQPVIRNGIYTPLRFEIMSSAEWDMTRFSSIATDVGTGATARVIYPDGSLGVAAGGVPLDSSVIVEIGVMGDMIPDGILDKFDVQAFATALRNPDEYFFSPVGLGDMNADGRFDFDDRDGFKNLVDSFFPGLTAAHVDAALVPEPHGSRAIIFACMMLFAASRRRRM